MGFQAGYSKKKKKLILWNKYTYLIQTNILSGNKYKYLIQTNILSRNGMTNSMQATLFKAAIYTKQPTR